MISSSRYGADPSIHYAEDEGDDASKWLNEVLEAHTLSKKNPKDGSTTTFSFRLVWMPPNVSGRSSQHPTYGHLFHPDARAFSSLYNGNRYKIDATTVGPFSSGSQIITLRRFVGVVVCIDDMIFCIDDLYRYESP